MIVRAIMEAMPSDGSVPPLAWGAIEGIPPAGHLHAALEPAPSDADHETAQFGRPSSAVERRMGGQATMRDAFVLLVTGPPRSGLVCMAMADRIADVIAGLEGVVIPETGTRDFLAPTSQRHPPHVEAVIETYNLTDIGRVRIFSVLRGRPGYGETRETRAVTVELPITVQWAIEEIA